MLDLYCERTAPGLLGEPLNLLTNLAFPLAAWASWRWLGHRRGAPSAEERALIALIVAVGAGSALFHALASPLGRIIDAAPILLFQAYALWLYMARVAKVSPPVAALAVAGLAAAGLAGRLFPHVANGSLVYFPAAAVLLQLGLYHFRTGKGEPLAFLAAGGVFGAALVFRTIDLAVCPEWPLGTHFLWHLLNAASLHLVFRGIAANLASR